MNRRTFLTMSAAIGAASVVPVHAAAESDAAGVLVDTTLCVGCRACEAACAESNGLSGPAHAGDRTVLESRRTTDPHTFTIVNRVSEEPERYAKRQCMHCVEPGCATACPARALEKTAAGPVIYHPERCLGCRYCMVACPYEIPQYEYDSPAPYVRKCSFCAERQAQGLQPACTSVCPSGALTFGRRAALLEEAHRRIYQPGSRYVPHVFGEREGGGTSWLYISDVSLDRLGLPTNLPEQPYSSLPQVALAAVPFVLTLWPPFLMALHTFSARREALAADPSGAGQEAHHG